MNKKLKLAFAALLGFSAACSSVKNAPAKGEGQQPGADSPEVRDSVSNPRIVVMYGVRFPDGAASVPLKQVEAVLVEDDQLDPVAEKPVDDTPVMDTQGKKDAGAEQPAGK